MTDIIRIKNAKNYMIEIDGDDLLLTPKVQKIPNMTEEEFIKLPFTNSVILECNISDNDNNTISTKLKYTSICVDIWKSMSAQKILQNTSYNCKLTNENGAKGYVWYPEINMSIQHKDSCGAMKEIINMIKLNKYKLKMTIKLYDDRIISYVMD